MSRTGTRGMVRELEGTERAAFMTFVVYAGLEDELNGALFRVSGRTAKRLRELIKTGVEKVEHPSHRFYFEVSERIIRRRQAVVGDVPQEKRLDKISLWLGPRILGMSAL